jgi:ABC-2 type transport system ATP-binding protein
VVIIDHGRVVAEGTQSQLYARLPAAQTLLIEIEGEPDDAALAGLPVTRRGQVIEAALADLGRDAPALLAALAARGVKVRTLNSARATLEDVFLQLTGRALRD